MKPGTYTQLYIHLVFAVKNRECLIKQSYKEKVFSYMSGIITNLKHKSIIVNGMPDHIHILLGLNPNISISNTVKEIKRSSSIYIKEQKWFKSKFAWQEGYGAFSYSRSQLNNIYKYIENQEEHHKKQSFKDEYLKILKRFDIDFNYNYLFNFLET